MSYYVSLGDVDLDNVVSVTQSGDRDISVYDSVGGGKFAVAQNKGLRTWTIKFQTDDPDIFDDFDKMLIRKTPTRLIVKSDNDKVSERVLLKSYSKEESEYAGVYNVTVTVLEYVKAGVKTASVPYVARSGNRVLPAQVTIGDGKGGTKTAFQLALEAEQAGLVADGKDLFLGGFVRDENGHIIYNPVTTKEQQTVSVAHPGTSDDAWASEAEKMAAIDGPHTAFAAKVEAAMDKAWNDFWAWANTPM